MFHQQIMKDKWINVGYDGEELKPHTEPVEDYDDTGRIGEKSVNACCLTCSVGETALD